MRDRADTTSEARVISPGDPTEIQYLNWMAGKLAKQELFWEDRMRLDPKWIFKAIFCNPESFAVDVGPRHGILAIMKVAPGHRGILFGASWGPKAMRNAEQRRQIATAAMAALNLLVIDGYTKYDNMLARRAMEDAGMTFRGRIVGGLCYNGAACDGAWYEFHRDNTALPPLE